MVRKNIVVIRVVTLEDQTLLRMHGDLIEAYYPALRTDSYCIGEQPRGVCDLKTKTLAVPKIIALAKKHQDADAIVISCCDDPAVEELREMLSVPVIGAGTAVSAVARSLGKRVGIIGITEYVPEPYRRILGDDLIDLGRPEGVTCTLDLMIGAGRVIEGVLPVDAVLRKARELKAQGANCIALACTGMSTIRIAREIENSCGIPAVDPVMAEGLFAYYACLQSER